MKVSFIGAGHIGKALAKIINPRHAVLLWDTIISKNPGQESIEAVVKDADVLFLTVPSHAVRQSATEIAPFLNPHTKIVVLSKSLERGTRMTAEEILADTLTKNQSVIFMGGPMLAKEIIEGAMAVAVCGSAKKSDFVLLKKLFKETALRLEYSSDIHGVALAGVLKNVYALLLGIASGLTLGDNAAGWLMSRSIGEMEKLMPRFHGKRKTLLGAAGVGDFIATAISASSTNHRAGEEIGRTGKTEIQSEGVIALPSLIKMIGDDIKKFPLLSALNKIINNSADPGTTIHELVRS